MKDRSEADQGQKYQPDQVTEEEIAWAITKEKGYIARAAKRLDRSPDMIYQRMASSKMLRDLVTQIREERLDHAETKLATRINKGELRAICYYLDAQGRSRGYGRQLIETESEREKPIEKLSDDELRVRAEEIRRRMAELRRGTDGPPGPA